MLTDNRISKFLKPKTREYNFVRFRLIGLLGVAGSQFWYLCMNAADFTALELVPLNLSVSHQQALASLACDRNVRIGLFHALYDRQIVFQTP